MPANRCGKTVTAAYETNAPDEEVSGLGPGRRFEAPKTATNQKLWLPGTRRGVALIDEHPLLQPPDGGTQFSNQ